MPSGIVVLTVRAFTPDDATKIANGIYLEKARNDEGMLSAESTADAVNGLISSTRSELLKLQQEYETQKRYVSLDAPQTRNLQARINAANDQIALLQAKLTNPTEKGDAKAISNVMSKLDYLELNRQISEKLYGSAMSALERARLSSESKMLYINSFVLPVLPQEAKIVTRRPIFGDNSPGAEKWPV